MEKKTNWMAYEAVMQQEGVQKLYHFTDRENLESIIRNGGLYSWADCERKNIRIRRPGGDQTSRNLDSRDNLQTYVRVSFTTEHPMMYVAMNDKRIADPVVLEIDPEVITWKDSLYADRNATKTGAQVGGSLADLKRIHFDAVKARRHLDLPPEEQEFFQAEVLVSHCIPLQYITNIGQFGIPIPMSQFFKPSCVSKSAVIIGRRDGMNVKGNPYYMVFLSPSPSDRETSPYSMYLSKEEFESDRFQIGEEINRSLWMVPCPTLKTKNENDPDRPFINNAIYRVEREDANPKDVATNAYARWSYLLNSEQFVAAAFRGAAKRAVMDAYVVFADADEIRDFISAEDEDDDE